MYLAKVLTDVRLRELQKLFPTNNITYVNQNNMKDLTEHKTKSVCLPKEIHCQNGIKKSTVNIECQRNKEV